MNFSGLDNFGASTSPKSPHLASNYKPPQVSSDNPFAEIESGNNGLSFDINTNIPQESLSKNTGNGSQDIYSYFESEEEDRHKKTQKNDFDLI
jgi:hypothetical protein